MNLVKIKVQDSGWSDDIRIPAKGGTLWYPKASIRSLESKQLVSWYHHDVFKKLTYVYWDADSGSETPKFYVEDAKLYNKTKLRRLAASDQYKQQKFAFFFYGEVQRLLGQTVTESGMSGLFARGAS